MMSLNETGDFFHVVLDKPFFLNVAQNLTCAIHSSVTLSDIYIYI